MFHYHRYSGPTVVELIFCQAFVRTATMLPDMVLGLEYPSILLLIFLPLYEYSTNCIFLHTLQISVFEDIHHYNLLTRLHPLVCRCDAFHNLDSSISNK